MRIHIITTPNREKVSFSYQHRLADILHKWLDINGNVILHSFSWLLNAEVIKGGLSYPNGSKFFIGFHDSTHLQQIVDSIMSNVDLCYGMKVIDVRIEENPDLTYKTLFRCASPIFIRRNEDDAETNYTYHDENAGQLMEETLQRKMELAGLKKDDKLKIRFDSSSPVAKIKTVDYRGNKKRVNQCPVIMRGNPETKLFAWNVGLGNSTEAGFGAIF